MLLVLADALFEQKLVQAARRDIEFVGNACAAEPLPVFDEIIVEGHFGNEIPDNLPVFLDHGKSRIHIRGQRLVQTANLKALVFPPPHGTRSYVRRKPFYLLRTPVSQSRVGAIQRAKGTTNGDSIHVAPLPRPRVVKI